MIAFEATNSRVRLKINYTYNNFYTLQFVYISTYLSFLFRLSLFIPSHTDMIQLFYNFIRPIENPTKNKICDPVKRENVSSFLLWFMIPQEHLNLAEATASDPWWQSNPPQRPPRIPLSSSRRSAAAAPAATARGRTPIPRTPRSEAPPPPPLLGAAAGPPWESWPGPAPAPVAPWRTPPAPNRRSPLPARPSSPSRPPATRLAGGSRPVPRPGGLRLARDGGALPIF